MLRDDYERWSRLGWGVLGYLGAVAGVFLGGVMLELLGRLSVGDSMFLVGGAVGGVGFMLAFVCLHLLHRLWRSGRRLSRAAAWWLRLPYRQGGRARRAGGWLTPRVTQFEPRIFARIMGCALLFLACIFGLAMPFAPSAGEMPSLVGAAIAIGVISGLCLLGLLGGVQNITSGLSEQDPLWIRIRDSFIGSKDAR